MACGQSPGSTDTAAFHRALHVARRLLPNAGTLQRYWLFEDTNKRSLAWESQIMEELL
jgi:hypothetical protein